MHAKIKGFGTTISEENIPLIERNSLKKDLTKLIPQKNMNISIYKNAKDQSFRANFKEFFGFSFGRY